MKRLHVLVVLVLMISLTTPYFSFHSEASSEVPTSAESYALIDVESGRILANKDGDKQMLIASITKIMTAIVAIEEGDLASKVNVGKNAYRKEGSSIYLKLGEQMNLEDMIYGLMLRSGNDAATAIAEHVGGSIEGFAYLMNKKADEIGMQNSHFMNPHGLNEEGHYSSANDIARLTAYALNDPLFQEIVGTKVKKVPNPHEEWDYTWYNKNKMLSLYEGADGVKTGYTKNAGRCLVSSATKNGQQLAVVTLNDPHDWVDHSRLLDYGFETYPEHYIIKEGESIQGQPYVAGKPFIYPLTQEEIANLNQKLKLVIPESVDYRLGNRGSLEFMLNDNKIGSVPIFEQAKESNLNIQETYPSSTYLGVLINLVKELFTW
ncbi:D-alanyl-D-alanine carboxypeptidase family protein [Chengkuizengella axinellae]|uniref:D-alanyl-D-alanine carboxypeptidase family protein n=1 Tax=Chengkuizengella axinellae TaxID=3064388 RepID=A0ABT9IWM0_9BACL|nr:D-alanyl-D-alanine carboxypeptidase family protein [Chengkuizengella sp. 2205SS18-9]MDP5273756.1 D-alanyl-D-alanine carboxypeptidase family protein [Chengkuizengella sp. 2205SS18-9]